MPKVSIIIPVYKVEQYIEKCARSLFEQTLDDIEYIFVNDCTPDSSMDILVDVLTEYPERREGVRIIDMPVNSGTAAVRKTGMSIASGDYVIHCDSDDWVNRDMYRQMYEKARSESYDMVICDYYNTDGGPLRYWGQHYDSEVDLVRELLNNRMSGCLWNKLVKREIFDNSFIFPTHNMCEDFVYCMQYVVRCRRVGYVPSPLYYYNRHAGAISMQPGYSAIIKKQSQIISNITLAISYLEKHGFAGLYSGDIIRQKLFVKNGYLPVISEAYPLWRKTFKEINHVVLSCGNVPFREKMIYLMTTLKLYPLYRKIRKS